MVRLMLRPVAPTRPLPAAGRLTAMLGPTNTGKTHFAIERMMGHDTGVIGLPLRLLAREVYDRVVGEKGVRLTALITGEEKIVPATARYFVCTVEAMPLDRPFAFVGVDEIQLCADPERGHVFTDRLLHARGLHETLFLGSETMRGAIRRLVPGASFISRPRLSTLSHSGHCKLTRLPRRSAIVAFSAHAVYAIAETVRRQRGGAAVVLGALSPRTRNAQVGLFEAGEVDFLVATDAIGMGLNLGVDHVAFADLDKFDGRRHRILTAAEIGQIAGRAGRYMRDGSFGTTGTAEPFEADLAGRVEEHRFDPVKALQWRSNQLDFSTVAALLHSLDQPAPLAGLHKVRDATDQIALRALAQDPEIAALAGTPPRVALLWQVAQIPDFRNTMADLHIRLLGRIFRHLVEDGRLPTPWVEAQLRRIDNTEGDIDSLAVRLAYIRTWTFVAHRADWVEQPAPLQAAAGSIEDRLSDALHARLTQRFVDRRASALSRRLAGENELIGAVDAGGDVLVEGEYVGRMTGLKFTPDPAAEGADERTVLTAANRALGPEIARRTEEIEAAADQAFTLDPEGQVLWDGAVLARLAPGRDALHPRVMVPHHDLLDGAQRDRIARRLERFVTSRLGTGLAPLYKLAEPPAEVTGAARGLAFRLAEGLGALPRKVLADALAALPHPDRAALRSMGVRFGKLTIYLPALLKPDATQLKLTLRAVFLGTGATAPVRPGHVSLILDGRLEDEWLTVAGFRRCGTKAVRIDMLERLDQVLRAKTEDPVVPTGEMTGLVGCSNEEFVAVMRALGYEKLVLEDGAVRYRVVGRRRRSDHRAAAPGAAPDKAPDRSAPATADPPPPAVGEAPATDPAAAPAPAGAEAVEAAPAGDTPAAATETKRRRPRRRRHGRDERAPAPPVEAVAPPPARPEMRSEPRPPAARQDPRREPRAERPRPAKPAKQATVDPDSPFAALAALRDKLRR